ncbi:MAG TPA: hypothetical protein DD396_05310 [Bacteroidetes bacterium]|nr:hypothetical protein [Bacteroidota bacterium]HCD68522.1 hypothetical protein [Bacteroidota bacterium]
MSITACSVSGPLFVTDNQDGGKVGKSSYRVLFGFALDGGDASIKKAAENGGITKISTVDQKIESGLIISRVVTVVTGE